MSPPGATETSDAGPGPQPGPVAPADSPARPLPGRPGRPADPQFLPNFCDPRMVLAVVLLSELVAVAFSLARSPGLGFFAELARISLIMQWLGLTSAALLCAARRPLRRVAAPATTAVVLAIVLGNILLLSAATVWFGRWLGGRAPPALFPDRVWPFAAQNLGIGLIVSCLLLRYFYVSHEWRRHVESEARARIVALQARIRPHFLFNSMNTIAALTRSDPRRAEEAVEDLADLFRASLDNSGRLATLEHEVELCRIYARIEQLRLGERLHIDWAIESLPAAARLPMLTLQPLLENAILHGIESLERGGTVSITGRQTGDAYEIRVSNPLGATSDASGRHGQGIATANIRERLALAFEGRAALEVSRSRAHYEVRLRIPRTE